MRVKDPVSLAATMRISITGSALYCRHGVGKMCHGPFANAL